MDAPNYAELHGAPTEQKEEWVENYEIDRNEFTQYDTSLHTYVLNDSYIKDFIRTQIAIAEERGRRDTITAFVEWAGKQEWLNKGDLLKFADSLKSNLTQKS